MLGYRVWGKHCCLCLVTCNASKVLVCDVDPRNVLERWWGVARDSVHLEWGGVQTLIKTVVAKYTEIGSALFLFVNQNKYNTFQSDYLFYLYINSVTYGL